MISSACRGETYCWRVRLERKVRIWNLHGCLEAARQNQANQNIVKMDFSFHKGKAFYWTPNWKNPVGKPLHDTAPEEIFHYSQWRADRIPKRAQPLHPWNLCLTLVKIEFSDQIHWNRILLMFFSGKLLIIFTDILFPI